MKTPKPKPQFCKKGHDTLVTGRDTEGRCSVCRTEWTRQRYQDIVSGKRVVTPKKQFCLNNHDTFICGRDPQGKCRQCIRDHNLKYDKTHREKVNARVREFRKEHKEECAKKTKIWRDNNKDLIKGYSLKGKYNITLDQYNQLLKNQNLI
jgi:hypothetical protein